MGAFEEFQRTASAGLAALGEGHELIQAARREYEEALRQVIEVAPGSSSKAIESLLRNLESVMHALDEALLARDAGVDEFEAYLAQIGAVGAAGPQGGRGEVGAAIPEAANPFRQELAGTDDGDPLMGKFRKVMRGTVRGAGDLKQQGNSWMKAGFETRPRLDPAPTVTYSGTAQADTPSMSAPPGKAVDPADIVGNAIVIGVVLLEAGSRLTKRRRKSG